MKDDTELVIIIDRSGSMHGLENDVIGGFNTLLQDQAKQGKTSVTTIFFNQTATYVHEGEDISNVQPLTASAYRPSGTTALLDTVGDAIAYIKAKHARLSQDELPEHTIFSIMTDGLENASKEYTYERVKTMIEMQKKCGWDFLFQAANIDVAKEGDKLGIDPTMRFSFMAVPGEVQRQMSEASSIISARRKTSPKK